MNIKLGMKSDNLNVNMGIKNKNRDHNPINKDNEKPKKLCLYGVF